MITDYVVSTIQYIENNLQVEAIGAVIIIALILLVLISLIFLAFRGVRLWYWRVNTQVKALEHIDKTLEEIKQNLPESLPEASKKEFEAADMEESITEQEVALPEECTSEAIHTEAPNEAPKIVFDKRDKDERTIMKPGYNIGKTGKIYAEETLREQIQF
ncbi:hypothetical protein [Aminipila luticellarii]|uniref:Uncharacterized protein n=1 Tax=Aminipila luticellarii TaxID=2507160 RepID=A0A410PYQ3_9FIRM|nr:hypothetical protein [Aminipila luticellarii]QAT43966.1 hypothetical protein EQM06_12440 [Aminipila luticellarii]